MNSRKTQQNTSNEVLLQFRRISSEFFGSFASQFAKSKTSVEEANVIRQFFLKQAAMARHPEPAMALIASYDKNKRMNRLLWRELAAHLGGSDSRCVEIWSNPRDWRQLEDTIRSFGYFPFPTFVPLGRRLNHFLMGEKIFPIVPDWGREGTDLFRAVKVLTGRRITRPPAQRKNRALKGKAQENRHELNYHLGLMKDITLYFSTWAMRNTFHSQSSVFREDFLKRLRKIVENTNPDRTLRETALSPVPFDRIGLVRGPIWPADRWRAIARSSNHWPTPIRRAAAPLFQRKGGLPNWNNIETFFKGIGLKPVPVVGYVGGPVYTRMLANLEVPVCSFWTMRYKKAPGNIATVDALHDIGHGLAMVMEDYRELFLQFSREALKWNDYLNSIRIYDDYVRYFELSYEVCKAGRVSPIGADSFGLDTIVPAGTTIKVIPEKGDWNRFYRFSSRKAWRREVGQFIDNIAKRKLRNVSFQPSPRLDIFQ